MIRLIKVSKNRIREQHRFLRDLEPETGFTNKYYGHTFLEFIRKDFKILKDFEKGVNLPPGFVRDYNYFLYDGSTIVGLFHIRPELNEALRNGSGHIGYGIKKEYRGKGYASMGLALAIKELKKMKCFVDTEVYMDCYKYNKASLTVMLHNGGYIHHEDDECYYVRIKV